MARKASNIYSLARCRKFADPAVCVWAPHAFSNQPNTSDTCLRPQLQNLLSWQDTRATVKMKSQNAWEALRNKLTRVCNDFCILTRTDVTMTGVKRKIISSPKYLSNIFSLFILILGIGQLVDLNNPVISQATLPRSLDFKRNISFFPTILTFLTLRLNQCVHIIC